MSSKKEAPQLTEYYHRARRNLTITSSLLLGWEFIGASFDENATLPVVGFVIHIRNPEVTPLTLAFFVLFFSLRLWIEWKQCDVERVKSVFSKLDMVFVYIIALASITLFIFQQISSVDFAKILPNEYTSIMIFLGLLLGIMPSVFLYIDVKNSVSFVSYVISEGTDYLGDNGGMYCYDNWFYPFKSSLYFLVISSIFNATIFVNANLFSLSVGTYSKIILILFGLVLYLCSYAIGRRRISSLYYSSWPRKSLEI